MSNGTAEKDKSPIPPSELEFAHIARGFLWLFWGLLASSVLLLSGAVIKIPRRFSTPGYLIGAVVAAVGWTVLRRVRNGPASWRERLEAVGVAILLQFYFAPFMIWWNNWPHEIAFFVNFSGCVFSGQMLFFFVALLAAAAGGILGSRALRIHGMICAAAVALLQAIPFLGAIGWAIAGAWQGFPGVQYEFRYLAATVPVWAQMLWLAPCPLVLQLALETREKALRRLAERT